MNTRRVSLGLVAAFVFGIAIPFLPFDARAQQQQMRDDVEQLAMDLKVGMDRSTLTEQQKAQLRDDLRELREAKKNHQPFAAMRAARSIRAALDGPGFKPEDKQRIKQDFQQIKEAREDHPMMGN
jgi:hypothetical protein